MASDRETREAALDLGGLEPRVKASRFDLHRRPTQGSTDAMSATRPDAGAARGLDGDRFFLAENRPDGTYAVSFTEEGIKTFETALGIAHDLGANSLISPYSTIADIMERTATREELSAELRGARGGVLGFIRLAVLRRKLRGTERPSARQAIVGHVGKVIVVLLFVVWTIQQFIVAVQDITAIPGILSSLPTDLLHPTAPFQSIGSNISDAGHHFLLGIVGIHLAYIAGALIRPFARIYRKDAIIPGERACLRLANRFLARLSSRAGDTSQPRRAA